MDTDILVKTRDANPIERTYRLSIDEFCIDWIAQSFHRLDFDRLIFIDYRFFDK